MAVENIIEGGEASYLNLLRHLFGKTNDDGTPDEAGKTREDTVTFTEEQQKHVDSLISKRLQRERERLEREYKSKGLSDEDVQELERYRTEAKTLAEKQAAEEQKRLEEQGEYKRIIKQTEDNYKKEVSERDELVSHLVESLKERDVDSAVGRAIATHASKIVPGSDRFIAMALRNGVPLDLTDSTEYSIQTDIDEESGKTVIRLVDEKGTPKLNSKADEMSLTEAVEIILGMNPQFVQANMRGGAGSIGSRGDMESLKAQLDQAAKRARESGKGADAAEFIRLRSEYKKRQSRSA